jgi:hypothetical protein
MFARDGQQRVHVGRLPIQVHRNDGLGARRDGGFDQRRIEVERGLERFDRNRYCAALAPANQVAMKVLLGTMTSSPGPMPQPRSASISASRPFDTPMPWAAPM